MLSKAHQKTMTMYEERLCKLHRELEAEKRRVRFYKSLLEGQRQAVELAHDYIAFLLGGGEGKTRRGA